MLVLVKVTVEPAVTVSVPPSLALLPPPDMVKWAVGPVAAGFTTRVPVAVEVSELASVTVNVMVSVYGVKEAEHVEPDPTQIWAPLLFQM